MAKKTLAIDPGANMGWAMFHGKDLDSCGAGQPPGCIVAAGIDELVVEKPTIYPYTKSRPNDIVTLAIRAGEAIGHLKAMCSVKNLVWIAPRSWKGTIEKRICTARIAARLTEEEKKLLKQPFDHNILDAIGLGWYACGVVKCGIT